MADQVQGRRLGDFLKRLSSDAYCFESCTLVNPVDEETTFPVGTPVSMDAALAVATPLAAAGIANLEGILCEAVTVPASSTTTLQYSILARGPAVIDKDELPTDDYAGDAFNMTTFQTELEALSPTIIVRTEPTKQERLTT